MQDSLEAGRPCHQRNSSHGGWGDEDKEDRRERQASEQVERDLPRWGGKRTSILKIIPVCNCSGYKMVSLVTSVLQRQHAVGLGSCICYHSPKNNNILNRATAVNYADRQAVFQ